MKTLEQLKLEKEVLNSQLNLVNNQINNFGYDEKKLQDLVGRYFQSNNRLIHILSLCGREFKIDNIIIEKDWVQHHISPYKPELTNGEYLPLKSWTGEYSYFTEITKGKFDLAIELKEKVFDARKIFKTECERLINEYNL